MREKESFAIQFNVTVQIQRPLEEIPGGSAIFFEFKHYKPKKGITSTKCFSFMEMDEIKPGKSYLEMLVLFMFNFFCQIIVEPLIEDTL